MYETEFGIFLAGALLAMGILAFASWIVWLDSKNEESNRGE